MLYCHTPSSNFLFGVSLFSLFVIAGLTLYFSSPLELFHFINLFFLPQTPSSLSNHIIRLLLYMLVKISDMRLIEYFVLSFMTLQFHCAFQPNFSFIL